MVHAERLGARQVDVVGGEAGEDQQFLPRAGDGDVEPALAALAVERAEIHFQRSGGVLPEGDREQHHVALVALHVLQILDDRRLDPIVAEEPFEIGRLAPRGVQQVHDERLLLGVEGDDAERRAVAFRQI